MTKIIRINISGPVSTGKSTIMASIREMLTEQGFCVAIPNRQERNNPSNPLHNADQHERPHPDNTVFVLTEEVCDKMPMTAPTAERGGL